MAKTKIDGGKSSVSKLKSRNPVISFDKLQMYFGEPYVIDVEGAEGTITLKQPTIGDIVKIGEKRFYSTLNVFITNTTSYRLFLWDAGVDWNTLSDFELFTMLVANAEKEVYDLFFEDIDFSKFKVYMKQKNEEDKPQKILYDAESKIEINEDVYHHLCQYLRNIFNTFPEEKITTDDTMKRWFINKDKRQQSIEKEKEENGEKEDVSIQSVISACINHPGFKYKLNELKDIGVCQFYDSVKRLQVYESATAVMKGMYSGFVDGSHIKPEDYNFMKNI